MEQEEAELEGGGKYQVRGLQGWEATRKVTKVGGGVKKPLPANMLATVKASTAGQPGEEKQESETKAEEDKAAAGSQDNADDAAAQPQPEQHQPEQQQQKQPLTTDTQSPPSDDVSHAASGPSASNPLATPTHLSTALQPLVSHGSSAHEPSTATTSYNHHDNQHDNPSTMAVQSAAANHAPRHSTSSNGSTESTTPVTTTASQSGCQRRSDARDTYCDAAWYQWRRWWSWWWQSAW